MPISCLIIEDNIEQNRMNKAVLSAHLKSITHFDQAFNIKEAELKLKHAHPDIILADVHLGDGNIFDLLKQLPNLKSKLIFTTSHSEYAIEAFKFSALSYLLKPYSEEDLIDQVSKTIAIINQENYYQQIDVLFHNLKNEKQSKRIVLKNHDLIHVVDIEDIYYAKADNNYTQFYCADDKNILVSKSLKTFETELAKQQFFRCHHSYLINLKKIKALHKSADAVILDDDSTIPIASRKKKLLQQLLNF